VVAILPDESSRQQLGRRKGLRDFFAIQDKYLLLIRDSPLIILRKKGKMGAGKARNLGKEIHRRIG
jgi:hypothetical protein